ncbi:hypothetical protein Leryth_016630 [Lithospermum erythrorhizon]|nr:hypothetical protein Leryth_016630 [Lithospermum erythrorhizon]
MNTSCLVLSSLVHISRKLGRLVVKAEEIVKTFRPKDQLDSSRFRCPYLEKNVFMLSWEPMVMWRAWRNMKNSKASVLDIDVLDCSNWCQVSMNSFQFFKRYIEVPFDSNGQPQLLKLHDCSHSVSFEERLPRHAAEFISCLPFKEVTHPRRGYLNLSTKLPEKCLKPVSGPNIHIAYGIPQEMGRGDSVTKLQCAAVDVVNILFHTGKRENIFQSRRKFSNNGATYCESTEDPNTRQNEQHQSETLPSSANSSEGCGDEDAGVLWDVFRRQDVPKLQLYLKFHYGEFIHTLSTPQKQGSHPVYDQSFYLTVDHKRMLKEDYKVGDSVIVPAGCPHQTRNLKSCISVSLDFISPESINESIRLTEEFRSLPEDHMAKEDRLELKKLILHSMSHAIKDFEVLKFNLDAYIKARGSMDRDSQSSLHLDEVFTASSQQDSLTTPNIREIGQPSDSPSSIQNEQIDMERVDSALKKLESFSSAKPNQLPNTSNSDKATMNTSPIVRAKGIWEDFMTYPLKVFGSPSNEVTALHALSELNENLTLFDDKEAKLLAEHKEIMSSIVRTRGVKEQLERENYQESAGQISVGMISTI